ncbi:MAG: hypothetical protein FJ146_14785 [Deltaproteobacteria bacterium]|nr:hypothetical protein [Deltaproteobacteria bacterium]
MLGIRRYHGASIDLWQGDSRSFVRDYTARATLASLAEADQLGHRHVVIEGESGGASEALATVKAFLTSSRPTPAVKRITFVLTDAVTYNAYQRDLFSLFPDEDH